jgi:hypothetical protein
MTALHVPNYTLITGDLQCLDNLYNACIVFSNKLIFLYSKLTFSLSLKLSLLPLNIYIKLNFKTLLLNKSNDILSCFCFCLTFRNCVRLSSFHFACLNVTGKRPVKISGGPHCGSDATWSQRDDVELAISKGQAPLSAEMRTTACDLTLFYDARAPWVVYLAINDLLSMRWTVEQGSPKDSQDPGL